jgi:hypothetical protein
MHGNGRFHDILVKYHIISAEIETPVSRVAPDDGSLPQTHIDVRQAERAGPLSRATTPPVFQHGQACSPLTVAEVQQKSGCEMGLAARKRFWDVLGKMRVLSPLRFSS